MKYLAFILLLSLVFINCSDNGGGESKDSGVNDDVIPDGDVSDSVDGDVESPNVWGVIVTTDYTSGNYRRLNLTQWEISGDLGPIHSDSVVRCFQGLAFIIHRLGSGSISYLTGDPPQIVSQFSVGPETNPQDVAYDPEENGIWVVYLDNNFVKFYSLEDRLEKDRFDLTPYADNDGKVEASSIYKFEGSLYIAVELLDTSTTWEPVENGKIIVIDLESRNFDVIGIPGKNPITKIKEYKGKLYIGFTGSYMSYGDEGIVEIDPQRRTSNIIVGGDVIQGNLNDFVIYNDGELFILASRASGDTLLNYTIGDREAQSLYSTQDLFTLVHIERWGDYLLITDRSRNSPGIRVWYKDEELFPEPLPTGLPPFDLCVISK